MSASDTYWVKREIHVSVVSPDGEYSTTVRKPFARIGSLEGSEVLLDENRAARRCLYLHATEEGLFFIRLDDFREHQGSGWLRPGRTLRVGDYEITARAAPPAESIPEVDIELDAIGSAVLPRPVISVRYAHQQITQRCLDQRLTLVGRKLPSALRVQHNTLSTFHCVLYWDAGILWVIDLLSSNRTRLNGHVVDSGELRVGRSIRLGKLKIRFDKLTETGFPPSREIVELGQAAAGEADNLLTTQRDLDEQLTKPAPPPDGSEAAIAGERPFHTTRATQPEIEIGKARESVEDEDDFTEVERWGLQERVAEQKRQRRDGEAENEADEAQPDARAQALEDETGRGHNIATEREEVWAVGRKSLQEQLAALGQQLRDWEAESEAQKAQFAVRVKELEDEIAQTRQAATEREDGWAAERHRLQEKIAEQEQQRRDWEAEREAQKAQFAVRVKELEDEAAQARKMATEGEDGWAAERQGLQETIAEQEQRLRDWEAGLEAQKAQFAAREKELEDEFERAQLEARLRQMHEGGATLGAGLRLSLILVLWILAITVVVGVAYYILSDILTADVSFLRVAPTSRFSLLAACCGTS